MRARTLVLFLLACPGIAEAQVYPTKPIRVIVPSTAGGSVDKLARVVGEELQGRVGQAVVIDNRPGAGGTIGAQTAATSAPDGYTLMMGTLAALATNPSFEKLRYDPVRDFTAISLVGKQDMMLTVGASSPIKSVAELIRLAKQNPNSVTYASAGRGTGTHLAGALFSQMSGAPMLHVGYKGLVPGMTDVIGGRVTCMFPSIASGLPMVRAGKVRLLAVTGKKRFAILPQVPTVSEAGVRGFEVTSWYGLVAPSKTPRPIVDQLNKEIVQILKVSKLQDMFLEDGMELVPTTPAAFNVLIKDEIARWKKLIQTAGLEKVEQ